MIISVTTENCLNVLKDHTDGFVLFSPLATNWCSLHYCWIDLLFSRQKLFWVFVSPLRRSARWGLKLVWSSWWFIRVMALLCYDNNTFIKRDCFETHPPGAFEDKLPSEISQKHFNEADDQTHSMFSWRQCQITVCLLDFTQWPSVQCFCDRWLVKYRLINE